MRELRQSFGDACVKCDADACFSPGLSFRCPLGVFLFCLLCPVFLFSCGFLPMPACLSPCHVFPDISQYFHILTISRIANIPHIPTFPTFLSKYPVYSRVFRGCFSGFSSVFLILLCLSYSSRVFLILLCLSDYSVFSVPPVVFCVFLLVHDDSQCSHIPGIPNIYVILRVSVILCISTFSLGFAVVRVLSLGFCRFHIFCIFDITRAFHIFTAVPRFQFSCPPAVRNRKCVRFPTSYAFHCFLT